MLVQLAGRDAVEQFGRVDGRDGNESGAGRLEALFDDDPLDEDDPLGDDANDDLPF